MRGFFIASLSKKVYEKVERKGKITIMIAEIWTTEKPSKPKESFHFVANPHPEEAERQALMGYGSRASYLTVDFAQNPHPEAAERADQLQYRKKTI
ncbi:MAG: hypothetical protein H6868_03190 [Rhodospirillales bacterium]|nr:hypothetical protein [Rhodospirillales bacterium]